MQKKKVKDQKKLRVEDYVHLRDAITVDGNVKSIGQSIILPSSYTGTSKAYA